MFKKLLILFFAILTALLLAALFRTFMHTAVQAKPAEGEVILIDEIRAIENLAESIKFQTISYQEKEKFPKQEFDYFIEWAAKTYPEFHQVLTLEQLEHSLLFKWKGSDATLSPILFEGHYDVVPIIPGTEDLWDEMPFSGTISNNRIWGRGALDDKSGVIGLMEAATYLIKNNFQPIRTVYFGFGHDEEIGGAGAALITEKLREQGHSTALVAGRGVICK
jgi:carboxypeptidase PM20D1